MNHLINQRLQDIPNEPGCYMMMDEQERILYVGKSKCLKNRVRSYFRSNNELSPRIKLMVRQVVDIDFIVTDSESEALTLESNLIKTNQPYFNILLKDDKKYPYLCITWSDEYPRIYITRRRRQRSPKDRFYGPFVDVGLLRDTLFLVKRVFPLRQRPRPLYKDRTCLNYSIGRCPGVCQGKITAEEYRGIIKKVEMVFQGRNEELTDLLNKQMNDYSTKMDYESAALVRDQIRGIQSLNQSQKMILPDSSINRDVIATVNDERIASTQIFQMRSGKLVGRLAFTADANKLNANIILQRVIEEHYSQLYPVEIPTEILIQKELPSQDLIKSWLTELKGRSVNIICPKRKPKTDLIELVEKNAIFELNRIIKGQEQQNNALEDLAQILELDSIPRRIEAYDISHIQGSDAVGSQIVFIDGLPAKQHYRKYKIKNEKVDLGHSDDFISLSEVIQRRFKKWSFAKKDGVNLKELSRSNSSALCTNGLNDWPDLILIDGGKGQLSAVMKTIRNLGLNEDIEICSLAKKKEEVFLPDSKVSLDVDSNSPGIMLLRRLRDESHRFAINYHRQKRGERMNRSRLSEIPGLGPKRIKELLAFFNSIDAIQLASLQQLEKTPGLGSSTAKEVWNYFHPNEEITSDSHLPKLNER